MYRDSPGSVYDDNCALFHLYKYENFRTNLNTLKKTIQTEQNQLRFDEDAVHRESIAFPRPSHTSHGNPYYDTSQTRRKLIEHAKDGTLELFKGRPMELKEAYPEYEKEFKLPEFQKHVNNERQRKLGVAGWQVRRNVEGSMNHHARYKR